jgi:hypothetical protein
MEEHKKEEDKNQAEDIKSTNIRKIRENTKRKRIQIRQTSSTRQIVVYVLLEKPS